MMIELEDTTVVILWSMADTLSGPLTDDEYVYVLRQARAVLPKLQEALRAAGVETDVVPDVPFLRPGSKSS